MEVMQGTHPRPADIWVLMRVSVIERARIDLTKAGASVGEGPGAQTRHHSAGREHGQGYQAGGFGGNMGSGEAARASLLHASATGMMGMLGKRRQLCCSNTAALLQMWAAVGAVPCRLGWCVA